MKNNKNVNVVSCPPCGENVGLPTKRGAYKAFSLLSPSIGPADHFLRKGGRKGFTLIELLVVVLIIGILAAVAVPQYQKAVLKTHYANIKAMALTYKKAADIYYLANGTYPTDFSELDADLPPGSELKLASGGKNHCGINNTFYCCLMQQIPKNQSAGITCGKNDYQIGYFHLFTKEGYMCLAKETNSAGIAICQEGGGNKTYRNLVTPIGHQTGYVSYEYNYL